VPGNEASLRGLFTAMAQVLVFAVPLLTMRVLAEEFASGTIEPLLTAPVGDVQVVLGKFLGVWLFYVVLLGTTLLHLVLVLAYGTPETGVLLFGYVGMLLLGALYVSVGVFASSLTRHQLLAAVIGTSILFAVTFLVDYLGYHFGGQVRNVLGYINVLGHFDDFSKGMLDTKALVFFISGTLFFLFLAVKVLESRRWR
jgi:ABC-2 type transport system permease protein